jgi:DNA invertase Pin-like site-specific DNA recombinase
MSSADTRPTAYSYVRISTEKQKFGDGIRRQTEMSRRYAAEHNLRLDEDFELLDKGVSAYKGDNAVTGELGQFLLAVESGRVPTGSYLLVESLDRLSRDKIDAALDLFRRITKNGVNVVTLADGQVYLAGQSDLAQMIYSLVVMSRAHEESEIKSKRLSAVWKRKKENAGTAKLTKMAPNWLQLSSDRTSFELVPDRVEVVRRIFQLSTEGVGTYSIVKTLNRDGVAPFGRSNGWNESYIEKIVKNRAVLGEYQPHARIDGKRRPIGDVVKDYYPAIISEDEFYAAQAARRIRSTGQGGRKGNSLKNLFTHIAKCAYCGAAMRMVDKGQGPKGGRYLRCSGGDRGMGCTTKGWRYDDFEKSFLFLAREVDLAAVMNAEADDLVARERQQREVALTEKAASLQLQRDRLVELSADPTVGIDFIRSRLASAQTELTSVSAEIDRVRAEIAEAKARPTMEKDDLRRLIEEHGSLTGTAAYDHRVRLAARLRSVVKSLTVSTEGDRPRLGKTRALLESDEADPAFAAAVMSHIEKVSATMQRFNPAFRVNFVGGVTRQATVSANDPMEYVTEALVKPDVGVKVDINGTTVFSAATRPPPPTASSK